MPGRRLKDEERRLLQFWAEPPAKFPEPLLKGIAIEGPPTLRGIERLQVPFDYPITAICGRNGVGESTVLSLTAFSAGRPSNWTVPSWAALPSSRKSVATAYAWNDFFFRHFEDPPYDGLKIKFAYSLSGNDIEIVRVRTSSRWQTMPDPGRSSRPRFPRRPIEFVSLARILPPSEVHHVRQKFGTKNRADVSQLNCETRNAISQIFNRPYDRIEVHETGGASLAKCRVGAGYSGFDMGAGENAAIAILFALQRLPIGGLLLVEEIEHGLHPEAQHLLIDVLTAMVERKKRQIIFTTHSEHIIDRLPRQARVLLERVGTEHSVVPSPTTRLVMSNMMGVEQPEATLYVEDNFSEVLVSRCLPKEIRGRVRVIPVGDKSRVAGQLGAHIRGGNEGPAMCVFDGDCNEAEIKGWMRREGVRADQPTHMCLPGDNLSPEQWVVRELASDPYFTKFADRIECDSQEATDVLNRLRVLPDHHDVPYQLAELTGLSEIEAVSVLVDSLASAHPSLEEIRNMIRKMID